MNPPNNAPATKLADVEPSDTPSTALAPLTVADLQVLGNEPRISHHVLAKRLGVRPDAVKRRHETLFKNNEEYRALGEAPLSVDLVPGSRTGQKADHLWLNELQSYVVSQGFDSEPAVRFRINVAKVFALARAGKLQPVTAPASAGLLELVFTPSQLAAMAPGAQQEIWRGHSRGRHTVRLVPDVPANDNRATPPITVDIVRAEARIAAREVLRTPIPSVPPPMLPVPPAPPRIEARGVAVTATELGKHFLPALSAQKVNLLLERCGLQVRDGERWILTAEGRKYAELNEGIAEHANGSAFNWGQIRWFLSVLPLLRAMLAGDSNAA